MAPNVLLSVT